eukprot:6212368-Pleurochrysis_carterae.AAC.1
MDMNGESKRQDYDTIVAVDHINREAGKVMPFEDGATAWRRRLRELRDFIGEHGGRRRPSKASMNADEKRLAKWVNQQQFNYARNANIMKKNTAIRDEWEAFVEAHGKLFEDSATAWRRTLREVQCFMDERGMEQRPSRKTDDEEERRLSRWIDNQHSKYVRNAQIMKDVAIRDEWVRFMNERSVMFEYRATAWKRMFRKLRDFIDERGGEQRPSRRSGDAHERRLAQWMRNQESNYNKKEGMMKNVAIREEWCKFVETHATLFGEGSKALRRVLRNFEHFMKELDELC